MINKSNIILVTNDKLKLSSIINKITLLRKNDLFFDITYKDIRKIANKLSNKIILLHVDNSLSESEILKQIRYIKESNRLVEIILIIESLNTNTIIKAYDLGIYDYLSLNSPEEEIIIKIYNCIKYSKLMQLNIFSNEILTELGIKNEQENIYDIKYLDIIQKTDYFINNYKYIIQLTLSPNIRTKISQNRLLVILPSCLRKDDLVFTNKNNKLYIIPRVYSREEINPLIKNIQHKMGEDFPIRAGMTDLETTTEKKQILKYTQDALTSAISREVQLEYLSYKNQNMYIGEVNNTIKTDSYKILNKLFTNKLENVIEPIFYRYFKQFEKNNKELVNQYSNEIESVFSLKNDDRISELIIRNNGHLKFEIQISHSGLNSPENRKFLIPFNKFTTDYLTDLLENFHKEFQTYI